MFKNEFDYDSDESVMFHGEGYLLVRDGDFSIGGSDLGQFFEAVVKKFLDFFWVLWCFGERIVDLLLHLPLIIIIRL